MLEAEVALVQMADLMLVAVALEDLVVVVAVQALEILDQQLTTELLIMAVVAVAQIHKHLLLAVQASSSFHTLVAKDSQVVL
jgi:hypothetical protein